MTERGFDSEGSGPRSAAEAARRRLYMPGGSSEAAVDEFQRLAGTESAEAEPAESAPEVAPPDPAADVAEAPVPPGRPRRSRRRVVLVAVGGAGVALVVALVLQAVGPRPLPATVPVPRLAGTTLLYHSRPSNPESAPRFVTFEPASYAVFFPRGRRVGVALRCVGDGTVRISAVQRFTFHCTTRETVQVQTTAAGSTRPFLILGRTIGNVVWSVRVVLLPAGS